MIHEYKYISFYIFLYSYVIYKYIYIYLYVIICVVYLYIVYHQPKPQLKRSVPQQQALLFVAG